MLPRGRGGGECMLVMIGSKKAKLLGSDTGVAGGVRLTNIDFLLTIS